jgi:Uma2 family endonuclease
MAETDDHRNLMLDLIETVKLHRIQDPLYYVSGNLLVYYVPGDRLRHLSPDFFVVRGVPKHNRDYYLTWEEGKGLEVVIELTSRSTRDEDVCDKMWLYRDVLKVYEYFLFDPHNEYLQPQLQGYRLSAGNYVPIEPLDGRLPSEVLEMHLERNGNEVRLHNPATGQWLPTPKEAAQQAEAARAQAETARRQAETARRQAETDRRQAESDRAQADAGRAQADAGRAKADADRAQAEAGRAQAEAAQRQTELARQQVQDENDSLRHEIALLRKRASDQP